MTPEETQQLIKDIYATVDRTMVVAHVVGAENMRENGGYITFVCPACGELKAFLRKPSNGHKGVTVKCSRASCDYFDPISLIDFVAGERKVRGEKFKRAVATLAQMIGKEYGEGKYKPLSGMDREKLAKKIKANVPTNYYDPKPELIAPLKEMQANVGSTVKDYLKSRGIPLELAKQFGVGFASYGKWPHRSDKTNRFVRQSREGRIVFPIYNSKGELMNLYGRAIENQTKTPKEDRHDFLPGTKGIGNEADLAFSNVHIVEGYFDMLSIKAARPTAHVAVAFGAHGFDWHKVKATRICFCFDPDEAGEQWQKIAKEWIEQGKNIFFLDPSTYEGCKDLNDLWIKKNHINFKYRRYKG